MFDVRLGAVFLRLLLLLLLLLFMVAEPAAGVDGLELAAFENLLGGGTGAVGLALEYWEMVEDLLLLFANCEETGWEMVEDFVVMVVVVAADGLLLFDENVVVVVVVEEVGFGFLLGLFCFGGAARGVGGGGLGRVFSRYSLMPYWVCKGSFVY